MDKTLHQKLINKYHYAHTGLACEMGIDDIFAGLRQEMKIVEQAANDLLSPRPEAIARIMELSRAV
ncbi:MAG: hypothetical protein H7257_06900 [Taibaiella sp.]|nr:hypothetical protein [Taibaiella sp.]